MLQHPETPEAPEANAAERPAATETPTRRRQFLKDKSGATVVEYCIIAGIITLAVVAGATSIGQSTNNSFEKVKVGVWGN